MVYSGSLFMRNYISFGKSKNLRLLQRSAPLLRVAARGKHISGNRRRPHRVVSGYTGTGVGHNTGPYHFHCQQCGGSEALCECIGVSAIKNIHRHATRIYEGSFEHSGVDFKVDIFSINIGVSFYFDKLKPYGAFQEKEEDMRERVKKIGKKRFWTPLLFAARSLLYKTTIFPIPR